MWGFAGLSHCCCLYRKPSCFGRSNIQIRSSISVPQKWSLRWTRKSQCTMENLFLTSLASIFKSFTFSTIFLFSSLSIFSPYSASSLATLASPRSSKGKIQEVMKILDLTVYRPCLEVTEQHQRFPLSQWKNYRMSLLQVVFFALFWAPYVMHQTWLILQHMLLISNWNIAGC